MMGSGIVDPENLEDYEEVCEEWEKSLSPEKESRPLALARAISKRHGELYDVRRKAFGSSQRHLRAEKTDSRKLKIFEEVK